jgi:hypothetical protein
MMFGKTLARGLLAVAIVASAVVGHAESWNGPRAVAELLARAHAAGVIPRLVVPELVE